MPLFTAVKLTVLPILGTRIGSHLSICGLIEQVNKVTLTDYLLQIRFEHSVIVFRFFLYIYLLFCWSLIVIIYQYFSFTLFVFYIKKASELQKYIIY